MTKLDPIDLSILRALQEDSKQSAKEIASQLGLTPSPVYERIRRLEQQGYIQKYVAILNKELLGLPITAMCQVSMQYHNEDYIEKFIRQIQALDEVQECYHMAGSVDFILKIHVASLEAYHDFIKYKLSKIQNIGVLNSTFVLKEIKRNSTYFI